MELELQGVQPHGEDHILATLDITKDGATVRTAYIFPRDTLEWRAAEYGIDPADTETLLDIVLYEPHLEIPPDKHLYGAETVKEAREHLLKAVSAKKAEAPRGKASGAARVGSGAREALLSMCAMDREVVRVKSEMVGVHRERMRGERSRATRAPLAEGRASQFKNKLKEMTNATDPHGPASAGKA